MLGFLSSLNFTITTDRFGKLLFQNIENILCRQSELNFLKVA